MVLSHICWNGCRLAYGVRSTSVVNVGLGQVSENTSAEYIALIFGNKQR